MNWIRNNKFVMDRKKMEPGATFSAFENHWSQAVEKMGTSEDPEAAIAVISHFSQMIALLRLGRGEEETSEQSCKMFWIQNKCSDQALSWLLELKNKGLQFTRDDDERLVTMLHTLCELASRDGDILGYVRHNKEIGEMPLDGACSLASLLLEYSLGNGMDPTLGETARYSFILLIKLGSRFPALEKSLSLENGYGYTHLVVSGLCACFAQLPTHNKGATSEQIRPFVQQLKFVDDITHEAPLTVANAMAECFSNAFLDSIIKPALTQDEGGFHKRGDAYVTSLYEGEAVVTRYLQTICELLTHPLLIKSLMEFIISMLQSTFLRRLNHPHVMVTVSTLSLFNVLLDFYCEDFWYDVVLQHLLSQNHRMVLQRKTRISEIDFHDSSVRFLSLLPTSIVEVLGQDILVDQYMQYLNNESRRLASLDFLGLGFFSPTTPKEDSTSLSTNPVYPRWKLRYDGTDENPFLTPTKKVVKDIDCSSSDDDNSDNNNEEKASMSASIGSVLPNGNKNEGYSVESGSSILESEGFLSNSKSGGFESVPPQYDPLHSTDGNDEVPEAVFTSVSLQQGLDDLSSIGLSEQSFDSLGSESSGLHINRHATIISTPVNNNFGVGTNSSTGANLRVSSLTNTNNSDGYSSFIQEQDSPSKSILENRASFGPFLDCLFQHLGNWTVLEPDVILMVTDLLSQLAGSRIPLVNSLLLDSTLILQPSYLSFASLLNKIRSELDTALRNHPTIVLEVWNSMSQDNGIDRIRRSSTSSTNSHLSTSSSFDSDSFNSSNSFGEAVRKKISSGATIAAKFQSVFGFSSRAFYPSHVPPAVSESHDSPESSMSSRDNSIHAQKYGDQKKNNRYMPSPHSPQNQNYQSPQSNPHDPLRLMATRAIFFSHWLLELAAISQQLCWKRA